MIARNQNEPSSFRFTGLKNSRLIFSLITTIMRWNRGGRPRKETGKKDRRVVVYLTEEELAILVALEKETGLTRSILFIGRVLDEQDYFVTRDVIQQLASIGQSVGRVGNNINQLAKQANLAMKNQYFPPSILEAFNKQMWKHFDNQTELHKLFRQMYRVMKKPNRRGL